MWVLCVKGIIVSVRRYDCVFSGGRRFVIEGRDFEGLKFVRVFFC